MEKAEAVPGFSVSQAMIDEFHIMFEDESPQGEYPGQLKLNQITQE